MARRPATPAPADEARQAEAARKALQEEANDRLKECRDQKSWFKSDLEEAYFFTAPRRVRQIDSQSQTQQPPGDDGLLNTSIGRECAQDFVTEVMNTFLAEHEPWARRRAGADIPPKVWQQVADQVEQDDRAVFEAIKASNFYPAFAMGALPDLALGTLAMWIDDLRPAEPIVCQPVPLRELEINVGPYGQIDDRFIIRRPKHRQLPAVLPGVRLPREITDKYQGRPHERCEVSWGFWRLWDRPDETWQHVVMVAGQVVHQALLTGAGSCPLVVGRWGPDPMYAYGHGPTVEALPDLRHHDEIRGLQIEYLDRAVSPPFVYPDDGVINFEAGIEPGMGYPARPGSADDFKSLLFEGDADFTFYSEADLIRRIKRLHFNDKPEQRGDTPPTATQWYDEMLMSQRRIGTPGRAFWAEFPAPVFQRFAYILEKRGTIRPIKVDGKAVALQPYNPAAKAVEQQDVQTAMRFVEFMNASFREASMALINAPETAANLKQKLGDQLVVLNDPEQIAGAIKQFAPLIAGGGMGGGGAPELPGP